MDNLLDEIAHSQKQGKKCGIASICSAHPWVLRAALRGEKPVLIESTCNQVNQFGGYTGMAPEDFVRYAKEIGVQNGFPGELLILGGDHLGPSPWQEEPAASAMSKAKEMVRLYVKAGFTKIHLDASMRLNDDPPGPLDPEISAFRTAELARIADESICSTSALPRYVIGTEVPIPGGAQEHEDGVRVTTVEDARRTLEITRSAFLKAGVEKAWERVIAMVVQPGVEFGNDFVLDYQPAVAHDLAVFSETTPLVFEAHSTDYQRRENLLALVRDHFAFLKVGPALTFAYREAIFALVMMENELIPEGLRSNLVEILENAMTQKPEYWQKYYRGDETAKRFARKFSLSDRIRYYWSNPQVQVALNRLFTNLGERTLPLALVSQFMPGQRERIRSGEIDNSPGAVILDRINAVLEDYATAPEEVNVS